MNTPGLSVLWPTFTDTNPQFNDETYTQRGDALYLVCADKNDLAGSYVVFYDGNGETIKNASSADHIRTYYVGEITQANEGDAPVAGNTTDVTDAAGHWYRVYIPTTAKTFKVFSSDDNEFGQGDIYELLTKTARYRNDYTLGDMIYRLNASTVKRVYPVFTEVPPSSSQTLEVSKRANEAEASSYISSSVTTEGGYTSGGSATPVLYPTGTSDITYEWTEGGGSNADYLYIKFIDRNGFNKGTYYWKESVAPAGYEMNEENQYFTLRGGETEPVTVIVTDKPISGEVILTKKAKEKVGNIDIGSTLAGAKFKLIKLEGSTEDADLRFNSGSGTETKEYSLGTSGSAYNTDGHWLETGTLGKLKITGLVPGDYCLEEQDAPEGYSEINIHTGEKRRVYFSVGSNTKKKEIECTDDMAPAYIKLFEHINEWRPNEWGDPTFVFRIKQTHAYAWNTGENPQWQLTELAEPKELLVSLTVNDNGTVTSTVTLPDSTAREFANWYVESTDELTGDPQVREYQGLFNIDSLGRIRVEPGSYEITRLPVSRYEFVTSAATDQYANGTQAPDLLTETTDDAAHDNKQKVIISGLEAGKTIDVHYYDKVGYYDKFTQVDEEVNTFYKRGDGTNGTDYGRNYTVKGIRVEDYHVDITTQTNPDTIDGSDTLTVNVGVPARFKAYFICVDGSERALTADELAKLNITYNYDTESGDKESFGNAGENNDFLYNTGTSIITVHNYAANYKNGVYTLKATYVDNGENKHSDEFDIVFERTA